MKSLLAITVTLGSLVFLTPMMPQEVPPGHPTIKPTLPQDHPQVEQPEEAPPVEGLVEANPADVASPEALVNAYYESVSGVLGQSRDWDRFRSLFRADVVLLSVRATATVMAPPAPMTVDQYVRLNGKYFEGTGYMETSIRNDIDVYGGLAQVFSTFESRHKGETEPYARGINGFQLVFDGHRWWINALTWQSESPENSPIPAQYLESAS
jgi:hypothetical protein